MNKYKVALSVFTISLFLLIGCENENGIVSPVMTDENMSESANSLQKVGRTMVWADGELFNSIVTPAKFKPESEPFDNLYAATFKNDIKLISESKPGDQDYNGGRWHLFVLKSGVDASKYSTASSDKDLDLNDFASSGMYFECPLLPRKNR